MSAIVGFDLDRPADFGRGDAGGMRHLIEAFPADVPRAWQAGLDWPVPASLRTPKRVVVAGVGGSAIGADMVAALALMRSTVPVQVLRGYQAPPADRDTLLVASSFSGNTRETLDAVTGEASDGAMRLAVTTGGELARLAADRGWPCFTYAFQGPPRSALAWGVLPLLAILSRLEALPIADTEVASAARDLETVSQHWRTETSMSHNVAKQIAHRLGGRTVLVIGAASLEAAARRWAGQLNENAKQWALWAALPEADHNLIIGFQSSPNSEQPHVVLLDAEVLDPRDRAHVTLTAEALEHAGVSHDVVTIGASTPLGALLEACHLGDWVSLYAALLNGVDPMSIEALSRFKSRLASYTLQSLPGTDLG